MSERKVAYQKRRLRYRLETKSFDGEWRDRLGFRTLLGAKIHATLVGYEDYRVVDSRGSAR